MARTMGLNASTVIFYSTREQSIETNHHYKMLRERVMRRTRNMELDDLQHIR